MSATSSPLCGPEISCDDSDPCTDDFCDTGLGCLHVASSGSPCTTSDICMELNGFCVLGDCVGEPISCDDANPCTEDTCSSVSGSQHLELDCEPQAPPGPTPLPSTGASPSRTPTATQSNVLNLLSPYIDPLGPIPYNPYQVIQNTIPTVVEAQEPEVEQSDAPLQGESENEVLENTTLNWGAASIGLLLVACAGCCAIFLGLVTVNKKDESEDDRLESVLSHHDTHIDAGSTVENPAFNGDDFVA